MKRKKNGQSPVFPGISQMVEVDNKYIDSAIDDLVHLVGVKECISNGLLWQLLREGKTKDCVEGIANYLGLPISVVLSYVPSVYPGTTVPGHGFVSQELAKTDSTGKGVESITAQVSAPDNLPLFGSSNLRNYFVTVRVSDNVANHPWTFMAMMAHELSHILLRSLQDREWDNEVYTDIASMLLGFNEVVNRGRTVVEQDSNVTRTTTYGYLSDTGFSYAYQKISRLLETNCELKKGIVQKIEQLRSLLVRLKKSISKFKQYIEFIDTSPRKRIRGYDAQQIVSLHQPRYVKKFEDFVSASEARLQKCRYYEAIKHYQHNWHTGMEDELNQLTHEAKRVAKSLEKDLRVLKKNMSFRWRLRITFRSP